MNWYVTKTKSGEESLIQADLIKATEFISAGVRHAVQLSLRTEKCQFAHIS